MRVAVNIHALPIYKKNRIASLLCIFETIIVHYEISVCLFVLMLNMSQSTIFNHVRFSWVEPVYNFQSCQIFLG